MLFSIKRGLENTLGAAVGLTFFVVILALNFAFIWFGSEAIVHWTGWGIGVGIAIMVVLVWLLTPIATIIGIIGVFYWLFDII